jgi:large subunit ribosomal protein L25
MAAVAVLDAVPRIPAGGGGAGRLRRGGRIPAVLYGGDQREAESIAVDPKALLKILHSDAGANTLIALRVEGAGESRVLLREYQVHPVTRHLLHADFYRVAMDRALRVTVPVHLTGEAKGVKAQGGIVDFVHRELVVECLPADIPEHITVDVTELMLHDAVRVRDLPPGPWKSVSDPDLLIVHVVAPRVEAAPEAAEAAAVPAAAPAEPEVIKKGKVEKAEDEKA